MFGKFNYDKVINRIKDYEYISFDIFDTLLVRNVANPSDIFKVIEIKAKIRNILINESFVEMRSRAAKSAILKATNGEVTLSDIYDNMDILSIEQRSLLKNLELTTESEFLQAKNSIYRVYEWCKKHNKKIIAVSDMYLPGEFLSQVLQKENIYCDHIFVSCELKASKATGMIFDLIIQKLKIDSSKIIHIGDSLKSDYIMARKHKWDSIWLKKSKRNDKYDSIYCNILDTTIKNNVNGEVFHDLGYSALGPLLLGFSQWLYRKGLENNISKFLFLSRDGKIMQEAFNLLYGKSIPNSYIYVSRRSLNVSSLWLHYDFNNLKKYIVDTRYITISLFLKRIGLEPERYRDLALKNGLDLNREYVSDDFWSSEDVAVFYNIIKNDVIDNSRNQYYLLLKYFEGNITGNGLGLVDIGWRGSMQKRLQDILASRVPYSNIDISGFYYGIEDKNEFLHGYLYESKRQNSLKTIVDGSVGLFESMFLAEEGTTLGYTSDGKSVVPILAQYENSGGVCNRIGVMHKSAIDFLSKIKNYTDLQFDLDTKTIFKYYTRVAFNPNKKEIECLGSIVFEDTVNSHLVEECRVIHCLFDINGLKKKYYKSKWRIAWLKTNVTEFVNWGFLYRFFKNIRTD